MKFNQRFDYYDLLGIKPEDLEDLDAEEAERYVEKAYKETARRVHPDKVKVVGLSEDEATAKREEATAMFQELQKAYEVIKEPMQREDYNLYRKKNATPDSFKPNLVPSGGLRFCGYSDDEPRSFFKVYGEVFDKIYANEVAFQELKKLPRDSVVSPPQIGDEHRPYPAVEQFYNYWLNFSTIMDFTWEDPHDEYDLAAAPTKKGVAVMKRKNMKARKKGRNDYNNRVRRFVMQYVTRRDKRVEEMTAKREEEMKKEIEEKKKRKRKLKKEKLEKAAVEYEEAEWTKPVERKRKYGVEEEEDLEEECWECVVCRKEFKSEKQWLNHEMSKKHKDVMASLMGLKDRNLVEDVLELMEEGKEDEEEEEEIELDDHVDEESESTDGEEDGVSECVDENPNEEVVNEEVVVVEEEEEEENEMEVLEAMVARRKTNVQVVFDQPMVTIIDEEDEVAMDQHDDQIQNNEDKINGVEKSKKPRRRRAKSTTKTNELGDDNKKESKSDSGEESCVDNGSSEEDEQKRKKGGKKEKRSTKGSVVESEVSELKNSKSGNRIKYAGKKDRRVLR